MAAGVVLAFLSGIYYWFPKMTGRMLSERLGRWVAALVIIGFHVIFFPQHLLGLQGMPRRVQTYEAGIGLEAGNLISSVGVLILVADGLLFIYSLLRDLRHGEIAGDDPWDARTLEWSTTSPPPAYNFAELPTVKDRDPVWFAKHPELIERRDPISKAADDEAASPNKPEEANHGVHIPGQSWMPLLAAIGICVGGYGAIYQNWFLTVLSLTLVLLSIYTWALKGVGGRFFVVDSEKPHSN